VSVGLLDCGSAKTLERHQRWPTSEQEIEGGEVLAGFHAQVAQLFEI